MAAGWAGARLRRGPAGASGRKLSCHYQPWDAFPVGAASGDSWGPGGRSGPSLQVRALLPQGGCPGPHPPPSLDLVSCGWKARTGLAPTGRPRGVDPRVLGGEYSRSLWPVAGPSLDWPPLPAETRSGRRGGPEFQHPRGSVGAATERAEAVCNAPVAEGSFCGILLCIIKHALCGRFMAGPLPGSKKSKQTSKQANRPGSRAAGRRCE